jgi:peptidylprolyl isomerase
MATITDPENSIIVTLKDGEVVIALLPEIAPKHVERMKTLARAKAYDNVVFHRVIDGFMAQMGCPKGNGTGGSGKKLPAEFNDVSHTRGICSMARSSDPNSGDSQFFICFDDASFLDNKYTVWGNVVEGMENVDKAAKGEPPKNPSKIVTFRSAA